MSAGTRPPSAQRAALPALVAVATLGNLAGGGGRVAVPLFALSLGASAFAVGAILACYAVLPAFLSIRAGQLVDRFGPRWPMFAGLAGQALGLVIPLLWHSVWALAASAALTGLCGALFLIAVNNTAGAISDEQTRAGTYSWISISQSAAQFAGPPLAGLLIDTSGHPAAFAVLAAICALAAALLVATRCLIPGEGHPSVAASRSLRELLLLPQLRPVFAVSALLPIGWELFFFFVPLHGSELGLSATSIGLVFSCLSVTVIASRAAVPWLVRHVSDWTLVATALGTGGAVYLLFPFTQGAATMMATAVILGAGMGLSHPVLLALLYRVAPQGRQGEALGVRATMLYASQIVSPLVLGAVGAAAGLAAALWPFALLLLLGSRYAYTRSPAEARPGATGRTERN